ncbi:MAG TPA: hypothetical protein VFB20_08460 [Burkholderiales bacterium]|nr:hypothetical protein [Burkholderiales bacterium]
MSKDRRGDEMLEALFQRRLPFSGAYRAASVEEPPTAVDEAILAASRLAAASGPRQLGCSHRRWRMPLAAAAVLTLAAALALVLQDQAEVSLTQGPALQPPRVSAAAKARPAAPSGERIPREGGSIEAPPRTAPEKVEAAPTSRAPGAPPGLRRRVPSSAASSPLEPPTAGAAAERSMDQAAGAGTAARRPPVPGSAPVPDPRQWLAEIHALVAAGRVQEAKSVLAEFRKAYPDIELPERLKPLESRIPPR